MDGDSEMSTIIAGTIARLRVRDRLITLQNFQESIEALICEPSTNQLDLKSPTRNPSRPQSRDTDAQASSVDDDTDMEPAEDAIEKAQEWICSLLSWHLHGPTTARAHATRCLRSAIEKDMQGRTDDWNDQERFYMAVTDTKLVSLGERLKVAHAVAFEGDFANRLATVKDKFSEHLAQARRAKTADEKANEARSKIIDRIEAERVDHFACAVPLSTVETLREPLDQEAACPICHNSFTDAQTFSVEELLADYPVRIKYCGHIVGKACLEQWMVTPKIEEAKYPHRSCPLCRTKIEGVPVPEVPATIHNHVKTDMRAAFNRRKMEDLSECEVEIQECLDAISACMSEEIAAEELLADLSRRSGQGDLELNAQMGYIREVLERLRVERWTWGFRGNMVWIKARNEWMTSGVVRK